MTETDKSNLLNDTFLERVHNVQPSVSISSRTVPFFFTTLSAKTFILKDLYKLMLYSIRVTVVWCFPTSPKRSQSAQKPNT